MLKPLILELATNGTCYADSINLMDIEEYRKNVNKVYEIFEKLCENMPEEEKRTLMKELLDAEGATECVAIDEYFKMGFKVVLTIGAETFLE